MRQYFASFQSRIIPKMLTVLQTIWQKTRGAWLKFPIIKRAFKWLSAISAILVIFVIAVDQGVAFYVRNDIYHDVKATPYRPYAVVLGTSKYRTRTRPNEYYDFRLSATKALFDAKKIDYILLSGDNSTPQYNEPRTMKRDLRRLGIDERYLFSDYAGFRTLDSVIRAKEVFHAEPMLIITQNFHCERAMFIAKYHDINAICFAADTPKILSKARLRDAFARVLMLWELLTEKQPRFLGTPEPLPAPIEPEPPSQG